MSGFYFKSNFHILKSFNIFKNNMYNYGRHYSGFGYTPSVPIYSTGYAGHNYGQHYGHGYGGVHYG